MSIHGKLLVKAIFEGDWSLSPACSKFYSARADVVDWLGAERGVLAR